MEALAQAGAFDTFEGIHRAQYFHRENSDDTIFLEKVIKHASLFQEKQLSAQESLFGESLEVTIKDPDIPSSEPWSQHVQLKHEKDVTGFYISGHPLDDYKYEIDSFCNISLEQLNSGLAKFKGKAVSFAGMVTQAEHKTARNGNPFGAFIVEDFTDSFRLAVFTEDYLRYKHLLHEGSYLLLRARIEPNRNNPARMEVKINNIILLAEALDKFTKSVQLEVSLKDVTNDLVGKILETVKSNIGSCQLYLKINDGDERISVNMQPKKMKIQPASFIRAISQVNNVEVRLQQ
jgi:DNA polymerase-3 subunit alpha